MSLAGAVVADGPQPHHRFNTSIKQSVLRAVLVPSTCSCTYDNIVAGEIAGDAADE
jgi:hypothetical protein